jgi:transcriptional regulator with XRE-family HTH domain
VTELISVKDLTTGVRHHVSTGQHSTGAPVLVAVCGDVVFADRASTARGGLACHACWEDVGGDTTGTLLDERTWRFWRTHLARALAGARHTAGLTRAQVHARTGIDSYSLCDYERGNRSPTLDRLTALATTYGTTRAALLTEVLLRTYRDTGREPPAGLHPLIAAALVHRRVSPEALLAEARTTGTG